LEVEEKSLPPKGISPILKEYRNRGFNKQISPLNLYLHVVGGEEGEKVKFYV